MKKYSDEEIYEIISKYVYLSDNPLKFRQSNILFDKLLNIKINIIKHDLKRSINIINTLLNSSDSALNFYGSMWAMECNYKTEVAKTNIKNMSENKAFNATRVTAGLMISMLDGKYGGWKRSERFPDLSGYE